MFGLNTEKNPMAIKIAYYHRFTDDILCLFKDNNRQEGLQEKYLNKIHPNLQFTSEIENIKQINFLDSNIFRDSNKHKFKIYPKPTATDQVIHNISNHPTSHMLAAFHSMVHGLLSIPLSKEHSTSELNIIKQITRNNEYNTSLIS